MTITNSQTPSVQMEYRTALVEITQNTLNISEAAAENQIGLTRKA